MLLGAALSMSAFRVVDLFKGRPMDHGVKAAHSRQS